MLLEVQKTLVMLEVQKNLCRRMCCNERRRTSEKNFWGR